jgi:methylenetetrahydrofolate dehydrogenase (NADP+)/methenyltetrahydrofolate cyclohydrolase/formyltetrahydrofolate synthetase
VGSWFSCPWVIISHSAGERLVTEAVSPQKDVDGYVPRISSAQFQLSTSISSFHAYNIGHLCSRASEPLFAPCTPAGVLRLLESTGVPIAGANTVVLGRSDIVGSPVASMLKNADATVTQCHSRSKNVENIVGLDLLMKLFYNPPFTG